MPRNLRLVTDSVDEFQAEVDQLPLEYLRCRQQHKWGELGPMINIDMERDLDKPRFKMRGHSRYIERRTQCERCTTIKIQGYLLTVDHGRSRLEYIGSHYMYPDNYLVKSHSLLRGDQQEMIRGREWELQEEIMKKSRRKGS